MWLKKDNGRCKKSLTGFSFFSNQNRIVTFHSEPKLTPLLMYLQSMNIEDHWRWGPRKAGRVIANCKHGGSLDRGSQKGRGPELELTLAFVEAFFLLQPGLLWLRSFFFNQSSVFGHGPQENFLPLLSPTAFRARPKQPKPMSLKTLILRKRRWDMKNGWMAGTHTLSQQSSHLLLRFL